MLKSNQPPSGIFRDVSFHTNIEKVAYFTFLNYEKRFAHQTVVLVLTFVGIYFLVLLWYPTIFSVWIWFIQKVAATKSNFDSEAVNLFISKTFA